MNKKEKLHLKSRISSNQNTSIVEKNPYFYRIIIS